MKLKSLKPSEKNPRFLKDDKFKILLNKILCYPNLLRENKLSYDSSNKNTLLGGNMRFRVLNHIATKIPKNELLEYIKTAQNALGIDNELLLNNSLAIFSELQETKEIPNDFLQDLAHLSDDEKDAFVIIDNTNEGLWDFEILANEWEIDNVEWNIPLGFEDEDDSENNTYYSDKNKEIDTNEFSDKMTLKLEFIEDEYHLVKDALLKIAVTPEAAIFQLLNLKHE
jgi:hypothetical protein